jgi:hypothetical protein
MRRIVAVVVWGVIITAFSLAVIVSALARHAAPCDCGEDCACKPGQKAENCACLKRCFCSELSAKRAGCGCWHDCTCKKGKCDCDPKGKCSTSCNCKEK